MNKTKYKVPFPQANDFEKIFSFCELIFKEKKELNVMVEEMGITSRQIDYYKNSCLYLELIEVRNREVFLVDELFELYRNGLSEERIDLTVNRVYNDDILSKCLAFYKIGELSDEKFIEIVSEEYDISENTIKRRMSSILSWFSWIEEYNLRKRKDKKVTTISDISIIFKEIFLDESLKHIRFYELNELLNKEYNISVTAKELSKLTRRTQYFFSDELHILFKEKKHFYDFL